MSAELTPQGLDPRIVCPTTGQVCPAQESLVNEYTRSTQDGQHNTLDRTSFGDEDDGWNGDELYPRGSSSDFALLSDQQKFDLQLTEYAKRSRNCPGAQNDDCPTRISMEQSVSRRAAVKVAKTLKLIRG